MKGARNVVTPPHPSDNTRWVSAREVLERYTRKLSVNMTQHPEIARDVGQITPIWPKCLTPKISTERRGGRSTECNVIN